MTDDNFSPPAPPSSWPRRAASQGGKSGSCAQATAGACDGRDLLPALGNTWRPKRIV